MKYQCECSYTEVRGQHSVLTGDMEMKEITELMLGQTWG